MRTIEGLRAFELSSHGPQDPGVLKEVETASQRPREQVQLGDGETRM